MRPQQSATVCDEVAMAVYNCGESCKSGHFWMFDTRMQRRIVWQRWHDIPTHVSHNVPNIAHCDNAIPLRGFQEMPCICVASGALWTCLYMFILRDRHSTLDIGVVFCESDRQGCNKW